VDVRMSRQTTRSRLHNRVAWVRLIVRHAVRGRPCVGCRQAGEACSNAQPSAPPRQRLYLKRYESRRHGWVSCQSFPR
jgi:hypothetical protein